MSEIKHTPEPWILDDYGDVKAADVYVMVRGFALSGGSIPVANSRRIVACVNACAGIPTEILEQGVGYCLAADEARAIDIGIVEGQRDKLLEALKNLYNLAYGFNVGGVYFAEFKENSEVLNAVDELLAEIEESK